MCPENTIDTSNASLRKSSSSFLFLIFAQSHTLRITINWLFINENVRKFTFLEQILIEVATILYKS